ncbi:hypothetical protein AB0L85_17065 [Streptomyces sp. NPDC052051]|uniref:Uncharacterized protein n=1 Tax=Streptomyces macrolidinus TaxID=2952607 RepID=A0ABT0ZIM6_9ACTN|nr:hypothetical protein [Streptomyces macrolidinus]MCN9243434.1 hypothetical protein [Streptomyces macrolidinus]
MSTSQPDEASRRLSDDRATPDDLLHAAPSEASPEDLVLASGKDITPSTLAWAKRKLAAEGQAAFDKLAP